MSDSQKNILTDFFLLHQRNALSHSIRSAVELGIVQALKAGQKTAAQLAEELQLQAEPLDRLLSLLTKTELIESYGDDYALSKLGQLIPDSFLDLGDQHWQHLARYVRTGIPLPSDSDLPHADDDYQNNKAAEEWTLTPVALNVVQALDIGNSRSGLRVLEIGCSSAVFSASLLHQDPTSQLFLLDDEQGLARAKTTLNSVDLQQQVTFLETETNSEFLPHPDLQLASFDLILLAGVVHQFDSQSVSKLLRQIHKLLKPAGELAIVDLFAVQEKGETQKAMFELELGLRTSLGQFYPPETLTTMLQEAKFSNIQFAHLPAEPYCWGLILSGKL